MENFKKVIGLLLVLCMLFSFSACGTHSKTTTSVTKEIGELAYNVTGKVLGIVVKEGNDYANYYVVSNDYNGKTLLVRTCPLSQKMAMSAQTGYLNSEVDKYLETEYLQGLGKVSNIISSTAIDVFNPSEESGTGTIERHVFILSSDEIGLTPNGDAMLDFFGSPDKVICYENPGMQMEATPYWLRNSYYTNVQDRASSMFVTETGELSSQDSEELCSIRPAFCVNSEELVVLTDLSDYETANGVMLGTEYVFYTDDVVPYTVQQKN